MSRNQRIGIIAASIAFAAILGAFLLRHYRLYPTTDDAYVDANIVGIVAQVAGPLVNLPIADNQAVGAGDLLFEIDPRPFRIAVEQSRAELDRTGLDVTALADAVSSAEAGVRYNRAKRWWADWVLIPNASPTSAQVRSSWSRAIATSRDASASSASCA